MSSAQVIPHTGRPLIAWFTSEGKEVQAPVIGWTTADGFTLLPLVVSPRRGRAVPPGWFSGRHEETAVTLHDA